jgi:uncharacterized membrane protein YadS
LGRCEDRAGRCGFSVCGNAAVLFAVAEAVLFAVAEVVLLAVVPATHEPDTRAVRNA